MYRSFVALVFSLLIAPSAFALSPVTCTGSIIGTTEGSDLVRALDDLHFRILLADRKSLLRKIIEDILEKPLSIIQRNADYQTIQITIDYANLMVDTEADLKVTARTLVKRLALIKKELNSPAQKKVPLEVEEIVEEYLSDWDRDSRSFTGLPPD